MTAPSPVKSKADGALLEGALPGDPDPKAALTFLKALNLDIRVTPNSTVKHLTFRLGNTANPEQGLLNAEMADLLLSSYKEQGFKIIHYQAVTLDPTANAFTVLVVMDKIK